MCQNLRLLEQKWTEPTIILNWIFRLTPPRSWPNNTTTILRPFFWDHPGEPVPEENFWTLWCKGRLREADTATIRIGATPSKLTNAHLHNLPFFYRPDALPATQPTVSKHWRQCRPNNIRGGNVRPSVGTYVHTSVCPSIHKKFFRFQWNLVCR